MISISNLFLEVQESDAVDAVVSTEIYGTDKKTYVNTGLGSIFKLLWTNPVLPNDETVDRYSLVIKRYDTTLNIYYDILNTNIELVNEYYVDSDILPIAPLQYMLSIYVVAYGNLGSVITSNVVNPYICKGTAAYTKVLPEGSAQPVIKRAITFAKISDKDTTTDPEGHVVALTDTNGLILQDSDNKTLIVPNIYTNLTDINRETLLDKDRTELFVFATKLLNSLNGWEIMQECYTKGEDDKWHINDI